MDEEWEFEVPTSFIDCVFLLLIFFILTAKFKTMERALAANLPKDGQNREDRAIEPINELRVKIFWQDAAGRVVRGPSQADGHAQIMIKANDVPCAGLNDLARKLADVSSRDDSLKIVIDARSQVPYRYVLGAVDACARAELANVVFQSPPVLGGGGSDWWTQ
jgi:biopolymer transport protein ExbD